MKYQYTSFYPPDKTVKFIKKPIVSIEVFGTNDSKNFDALIDSGADCSMFNIEIADLLNVDLSSAKQVRFTGISGHINGHDAFEIIPARK